MAPILNYFLHKKTIKIASFSNQWCYNVFLSLQCCMIEMMKVYEETTNYKVPHLGKHKLEREGQLPLTLHCDSTLVDQAKRLVLKQ
jgi:hypothetical protein